jgi:PleD family two-component response regulator
MIPDMNGLELLEKMKEHADLKDIPDILYTARKDMETVQKALKLECADYIVKPINADQLPQKVKDSHKFKGSKSNKDKDSDL